jgi:hypothetical protein
LDTETSAEVLALAELVEELLPDVGSGVVEVTFAVFEMVVPFVTLEATATVRVKPAVAPDAIVARLHVIVAPVVQENVGPEFWFKEANVVPAGSVSVKETELALEGPLLPTVIE